VFGGMIMKMNDLTIRITKPKYSSRFQTKYERQYMDRVPSLSTIAKRFQDRELMLHRIARVTQSTIQEAGEACSQFSDLDYIYKLACTNGRLPKGG
jgi:hypothetical protein